MLSHVHSDILDRLQDFVEAAGEAQSLAELRKLLIDVLPTFGVEYFLMTHHVDFGRPSPGTVQISNYPAEFIAREREHGGWRVDPALLACEKTSAGFFWSDIQNVIPLEPHQLQRFNEARRYGVSDGFVVPNHIPGEASGSVHFAVSDRKPFPKHMASALQSLATYGFEAARRLARDHDGHSLRPVPLTDRQLDCLLLAARGKSDTDIGQLLGISARTVNEYLEGAKRRYCVRTRQQLIVHALFNSQITFAEVLH